MMKTRVIDHMTYHSGNTVVVAVPEYRRIRRGLRHQNEIIINTDGSVKTFTAPNGKKTQHIASAWCLDRCPDFFGVEAMTVKGAHMMNSTVVEAYAVFSFLTKALPLMTSLEGKTFLFRMDSQATTLWGNSIVKGETLQGNFVENATREVRNLFLDALTVLLHRHHDRIRFEWVPGHQDEIGNERVDYLARLSRGEITYLGTLDSYDYIRFLHERTNINPTRMVKVKQREALVRPGAHYTPPDPRTRRRRSRFSVTAS